MDFFRNPEVCSAMCKQVANKTCDDALDACVGLPTVDEQRAACYQTILAIYQIVTDE
jgi:hypothetical protein